MFYSRSGVQKTLKPRRTEEIWKRIQRRQAGKYTSCVDNNDRNVHFLFPPDRPGGVYGDISRGATPNKKHARTPRPFVLFRFFLFFLFPFLSFNNCEHDRRGFINKTDAVSRMTTI